MEEVEKGVEANDLAASCFKFGFASLAAGSLVRSFGEFEDMIL
jgi:hypothetical protein